MNKKTHITTDESNHGIGAILWQKCSKGETWILGAASRSLNETEQRYSTIEKEALGVVWGLEKCHYYIFGASVVVETYHKPLVQVLESKEIEKIPLRIQRFRLRLMKYSVKIVHISGKNNAGADALSRYPAETNVESILEIETEKFVEQHTKNYEDVRRWSYLRKSQEEDRINKLLKEKIETKWKRKDSSRELDRYYQNRQYLSLIQECVMFQNRIIIPEIEKQRVLKEIHNAHQGVTRCIARAKESVWWFGFTEDIKAHVESCIECMIYENKKIETLEMIPIPKGPWEMLGTDIFQLSGKKYLLVVYYYSKYIELALL